MDVAALSLVEVVDLLASRDVTSVQLLESCLDRIEAQEPDVQAFAQRTDDLARAAAERADEARGRGEDPGLLGGVPIGVKDVIQTRGVVTRAGSKVFDGDSEPTEDAAVWARLRDAGAGLIGKTTTHEFAFGTASGPTTNPWDPSLTSGGSSGGSAAAVAARMVPAALGSDTAGSLRIPAAVCGISTMRPRRGRVSRYGVIPLSPTFDSVGPMARRMADVALLMGVLAGADPRDPNTFLGQVPRYASDPAQTLRGIRIGVPWAMSWDSVEDGLQDVCRRTLDRLKEAGAILVDVATPAMATDVLAPESGVFDTINAYEACLSRRNVLADGRQRSLYGAQVLARLEAGASVTPDDVERAREQRARWEAGWRAAFARMRLDVIAHPTIDAPSPPLVKDDEFPEGPSIRPSVPWSIADFAALTVPVGLDHRRLPVGLSLVGLPEREPQLLGLGIALDEMVGFWAQPPDRARTGQLRNRISTRC